MTPAEAWLQWWSGPSPGPGGAVEAVTDALRRFATDYARVAAAPAAGAAEWEGLARAFMTSSVPAAPAGPATPELLTEMASATAAAFARRLGSGPPPASLRAAFDLWIDAAEEAFRSVAFGAAFTRVQATLCNDLVRLRATQQGFTDQAAALAGLPSRAEVDALHDTVRELRRELSEATRPVRARRPAARRRTKR